MSGINVLWKNEVKSMIFSLKMKFLLNLFHCGLTLHKVFSGETLRPVLQDGSAAPLHTKLFLLDNVFSGHIVIVINF